MDDITKNFNKFKAKFVGKDSSLRKISWDKLAVKYPKMYKCLKMPHIFQPCESIVFPDFGEIYVIPANNLFYQYILYCPKTDELWETFTTRGESETSETSA